MIDGAIGNRIKRILVEELKYPLSADEIREDTSLFGKGLGLDSVDVVTLLVRLEDEFNVFFEADEASASVKSFGSLLRAIHQKVAHGAGAAGDNGND